MTASGLLLDAHVHFHPCFEPEKFLDAALGNLRRGAEQLAVQPQSSAALMLSENREDHFFRELRDRAGKHSGGCWSVRGTDEACSLVAEKAGEGSLYLVAGRQVVSREGLEVLALATDHEFRDGDRFDATVETVLEGDGLTVLPWGFGKWAGGRGKLISEALERHGSRGMFLGDNAGRLAGSRTPALFEEARSRGIWVLPGSDPFPLASQTARVGRYGCFLEGGWDPLRPAASAVRLLEAATEQPRVFGRLESPLAFCTLQLFMQLRKRLRRA